MRGWFCPSGENPSYPCFLIYTTPEGGMVPVTCVGNKPPDFDDRIDMGDVVQCVRTRNLEIVNGYDPIDPRIDHAIDMGNKMLSEQKQSN